MEAIFCKILIVYFVIINLITYFLFWRDKELAKQRSVRIPEFILIGFAMLGGSIGAIAGMYICHHKTRKTKFKYGVPIILFFQLFILILFWS